MTDAAVVLRATDFAAIKHRDQRRKNGDIPYINHPIGVARILMEEGGIDDTATLAAAILHDTVEDTDATHEELITEFGAEIAGIVAEVTDDTRLPQIERKRQQVLHAATMSAQARRVKLADKLYNLRDLRTAPPDSWSLLRIRGYFCWAWHVVRAAGEVNTGLQAALEVVFEGSFQFRGEELELLPTGEAARAKLLDEYYARMTQRG